MEMQAWPAAATGHFSEQALMGALEQCRILLTVYASRASAGRLPATPDEFAAMAANVALIVKVLKHAAAFFSGSAQGEFADSLPRYDRGDYTRRFDEMSALVRTTMEAHERWALAAN